MIRAIATAFFAALVSLLPVAAAEQNADRVTVFAAASMEMSLKLVAVTWACVLSAIALKA